MRNKNVLSAHNMRKDMCRWNLVYCFILCDTLSRQGRRGFWKTASLSFFIGQFAVGRIDHREYSIFSQKQSEGCRSGGETYVKDRLTENYHRDRAGTESSGYDRKKEGSHTHSNRMCLSGSH